MILLSYLDTLMSEVGWGCGDACDGGIHGWFGVVQYNGCKWRGGVLRVEKAKEHYTDRLRREWAAAETETAAKAKIAAKAAAMAVTPSRDMYTPSYEDVSRSPESNRVEPEQGTNFWLCVASFVCAMFRCVN
jgi:hypothetical protein